MVLLLLASRAAAIEPNGSQERAPNAPPRYRLDFRAGRVEADSNLDRIELSDHVVVRVDRYRLTSDRLRLSRGPRGIVVDGNGRVAFCPCPDPPVSIGFSSATVAPPTDLLVENPTLRVGNVPVLWLPYGWFRSSDRLGLLPPRLAYRGDDGLLVGGGIHVPVGRSARAAAPAIGTDGRRTPEHGPFLVDLRGAGYVKGGAEVELGVSTPGTENRVRWDHLNTSLLELDAHGASTGREGATAAYRVDAIRGGRAKRGTVALEPAVRRYDRAFASVARADGAVIGGVGVSATLPRGGPFEQLGSVGPFAHAGLGAPLGDVGRASASLSADTTKGHGLGTLSRVAERGELELDGRPGPFGVSGAVRADARLENEDVAVARAALVGAELRAGLPLVRDYGSDADPLRHEIEPFALGRAALGTHSGALVDPTPFDDQTILLAAAGLRTALGSWGERASVALEVTGGMGGQRDALEPVMRGRLIGRARWFALSSMAAWLPDRDRALVTVGRARLGRIDTPNLTGYAEGRLKVDAPLGRFLAADAWDGPRVGFFDQPGWTTGGELGVPVTVWLATAVGADWDVTARELLGVRGSLGYRHRCGCLAALAWAGKRIGRDGVDAWLTVDILP